MSCFIKDYIRNGTKSFVINRQYFLCYGCGPINISKYFVRIQGASEITLVEFGNNR